VISLEVTLNGGAVVCTSTSFSDCSYPGGAPAIEIIVDYGDGSGPAVWSQSAPLNIFQHEYSFAGAFTIAVQGAMIHALWQSGVPSLSYFFYSG
jgi:hypothetical protein